MRIWPGVAPASLFKALLELTLYNVDMKLRSKHGIKVEEGLYEEKAGAINDRLARTIDPSQSLHIRTLQTALRYADTALRSAQHRPQDRAVYDFVLRKLERNALKAHALLDHHGSTSLTGRENANHYLKATLAIENLMEYAGLLTSLTRRTTAQTPDPYEAHVSRLIPQGMHARVFYTDSGMQAIVSANLVAKAAHNVADPTVLDVHSYFEYDIVSKDNLKLRPFDENVDGVPHIIAADINPVHTQPADKAPRKVYSEQLERYRDPASAIRQTRAIVPIPIIDVTNSTISRVPALVWGYPCFIVVESLTKHYQLGSDKFTMGRVIAVGDQAFVKLASDLLAGIERDAYDPLPSMFRRDMDEVFYGADAHAPVPQGSIPPPGPASDGRGGPMQANPRFGPPPSHPPQPSGRAPLRGFGPSGQGPTGGASATWGGMGGASVFDQTAPYRFGGPAPPPFSSPLPPFSSLWPPFSSLLPPFLAPRQPGPTPGQLPPIATLLLGGPSAASGLLASRPRSGPQPIPRQTGTEQRPPSLWGVLGDVMEEDDMTQ